jgi:hypothetical protein
VRRLEPFLANVGKRLVKSPKVYLRDSGILHALLGLATVRDLQGHPVAGAAWEGFVVEQVAAELPMDAQLGFYRTAAGAELDLVRQDEDLSVHPFKVPADVISRSQMQPVRGQGLFGRGIGFRQDCRALCRCLKELARLATNDVDVPACITLGTRRGLQI